MERVLTNRDLKRLRRRDLLEILLELSKEKDALILQLEEKENLINELQTKLENKQIAIQKAGTIAEASFKLNGVWEAAENAAKQYLDNLKELVEKEEYLCSMKEQEVEKSCEEMLLKVKEQCEEHIRITEEKCRFLDYASHEGLRELRTALKINECE